MKLTKGIKPIKENITVPHKITTWPNGYQELEIEDIAEINRLKAKGWTQQ